MGKSADGNERIARISAPMRTVRTKAHFWHRGLFMVVSTAGDLSTCARWPSANNNERVVVPVPNRWWRRGSLHLAFVAKLKKLGSAEYVAFRSRWCIELACSEPPLA
jgi:hypothetical protein